MTQTGIISINGQSGSLDSLWEIIDVAEEKKRAKTILQAEGTSAGGMLLFPNSYERGLYLMLLASH